MATEAKVFFVIYLAEIIFAIQQFYTFQFGIAKGINIMHFLELVDMTFNEE
ncbi:hypothetical protein DAPPUDRAFT_250054 [Daphnia pulex]|uniref:Uncharacterized protein n=1 Tax=Daphnia pulex TaxID=6669 RepID=E9GXT6_DAPPU|nr:hypothetical protein DAPPUDRAFT_250054 [Daphnia pulex]|eukprot:EFX75718.1 hypothetical protein DAPPUDRAFT_250054 [Daphnia pulex]